MEQNPLAIELRDWNIYLLSQSHSEIITHDLLTATWTVPFSPSDMYENRATLPLPIQTIQHHQQQDIKHTTSFKFFRETHTNKQQQESSPYQRYVSPQLCQMMMVYV